MCAVPDPLSGPPCSPMVSLHRVLRQRRHPQASLQELLCSSFWEPSELPDSLSSSFQDEDCRSHESFFSESQLACRDVVWKN